ncbi:MAG: DUF4388 domain-containing protein [Candidatus Eisenbacteria bacterium]|uniref:DUF4388 domain-containing protein n=1 Tax=Eiseniibacteriota bacterium TaxID=2212470 RepID=A0A956M0N0_UNCEI|nr:DUF4388 domain-containing protein [Candidatus Eisenbacteria bacterium]
MALSGNLSEFSVLETLQVIALQQKTGTLYIESGKKRHGLHFRDGRLIGCQPPNPSDPDPFLDALVGLGQVGRDEERRIRMLAAQQGVDLWRQIGNSVHITEETLEETRCLVLQGMLDRILLWNKGHFEFDAGPVPPASGAPWNVETALLESMRRLDEAADLKAGGFPLNTRARVVSTPPAEAVEPDPENPIPAALERAIMTRLDGKRTLTEVVEQLGVAEYDVLTAVRELRNRGLVKLEAHGAGGHVTQILIEQPIRLRNPSLAGFLVVSFLLLAVTGFQVHRLTANVLSPRVDHAHRTRTQTIESFAVRDALEIHRQRHGVYPAHLDALIERGLWPGSRKSALDDAAYRVVDGGQAYLWAGMTDAATSSNVSNAGTSGSDGSVSRP